MLTNRVQRIRELSNVIDWLRHRHALLHVARTKYEKLYVENPIEITQAMFALYDKRYRVVGYLISCVELDLKTLASNGKAPGTRGRKLK